VSRLCRDAAVDVGFPFTLPTAHNFQQEGAHHRRSPPVDGPRTRQGSDRSKTSWDSCAGTSWQSKRPSSTGGAMARSKGTSID
jgi:hypothetical protein